MSRFENRLHDARECFLGLVASEESRLFDLDPVAGDVVRLDGCESSGLHTDDHEAYRCASLIVAMNMFFDRLTSLYDAIGLSFESGEGVVSWPRDSLVQALHMLSYHIAPTLASLRIRIGEELPLVVIDRDHAEGATYMVAGLVLTVLVVVIVAMIRDAATASFDGILAFVRRVPPDMIVQHTPLLNCLLGNERTRNEARGTTRSIIHTSTDGIVCMSPQLVIETVNTGMQRIFGYAPEQLLGQTLSLLFSDEADTRIQAQAALMAQHEAGRTFSDRLGCVNDVGDVVPCAVTLLRVEDRRGIVTAFVAIFRDVSQDQREEAEAQAAKVRNEKLLYEILPRGIVARINQGEKEISFVVESCTIGFLDIQKFSDYAATLQPQETLENLALIFSGYDANLPKYELCQKMKFVGDVYMLASGLFASDAPPQAHAQQAVSFGLDALNVIEEANGKLGTSLVVRIGINSGGPVIAVVLGTEAEKPVFDILGDPINVAARLQSTDIAGKVQISEDTFEIVKGLDFVIEPRGQVFLKGKGDRPAYLVSRRAHLPVRPSRALTSGGLSASATRIVPPELRYGLGDVLASVGLD